MTATVDAIRAHFPALERCQGGLPVAYFDGPGGTQVPRAVGDAMVDYLYHHNANTHWAYPTSAETDLAIDDARQAFADFFNARAAEVVFGANMTTLTFHVARAIGRRLAPSDEIVITELDHHGNVAPWRALEHECGVRVRSARMDVPGGCLDWSSLVECVTPRTKLVAIGAASNALGTVNDVRAAVDLAHSVGALAFVDGVHYAPHSLTDVQTLNCDFFVCSAYKFYGTHVGVMCAKREQLDALDFPRLIPAPNEAPERAETGTLNHEGIVGAAASVKWLAGLGEGASRREQLRAVFASLRTRGDPLVKALWDGLRGQTRVTLFGPPPETRRTPTVAFTIDGVSSVEVCRRLGERGLFASHGDFYAHTVVERLGLAPHGLVRVGCACYTTGQEVDRLVDVVGEITAG